MPSQPKPNVVLINCDDLGYGDLGCYGSTRNQTPALDRLAAEGLRFTSFYTASPVCSPARGALLTGCYPPRIGFGSFDGLPVLFPGQGVGLPSTEITLARVLSDAGYATQAIGKWHCGDQPDFQPTNHGFDHYLGLPYSNDMGRQADKPDFMPEMPPLPLVVDGEVVEQQPDQASLTDRYVATALDFIRSCDDQPFFLYLAHMYVHVPIYVQERFAEQSKNGPYGAAVASIDWATEVILAELDARGLTDDTIVIFTSDNGSRARGEGGSNDPLRGTKGETWEGGMRVPCIVRWPGMATPGHTCDDVASALDLLPTLAAAAGASPTAAVDGRDLTPLLGGSERGAEPFFYYRGPHLEAVRDGRWKLHVARGGEPVVELYDLVVDVGETADVAAEHPDVVTRLRTVVDEMVAELGDARLEVDGNGVRACGQVADGVPLTEFDPTHPYYASEYDLADRG